MLTLVVVVMVVVVVVVVVVMMMRQQACESLVVRCRLYAERRGASVPV